MAGLTVGGLGGGSIVPAWADPPVLTLPVACSLGQTCWVVSYPDDDPGPGAMDYTCGVLSKDTHKGTDFGIGQVRAGETVAVLAAAAGTVLGLRDGEPDISRLTPGAPPITGRECGNGVALDHGDGWVTQYCHLQNGSVRVKQGDRVEAGTPLGAIGLSGETEHPHLHLEVRRGKTVVDPFSGAALADGCTSPRQPLWDEAAQAALRHDGTVLYNVGFAGQTPDRLSVRAGQFADGTVAAEAPVLVVFVDMMGVRLHDRLSVVITGPDGAPFATSSTAFEEKGWVQWFGVAGRKKNGPGIWPRGTYVGVVTVERPGAGVIAWREVRGRVP